VFSQGALLQISQNKYHSIVSRNILAMKSRRFMIYYKERTSVAFSPQAKYTD
jgi:hypothetical protein